MVQSPNLNSLWLSAYQGSVLNFHTNQETSLTRKMKLCVRFAVTNAPERKIIIWLFDHCWENKNTIHSLLAESLLEFTSLLEFQAPILLQE